jgi:hypothetical protein
LNKNESEFTNKNKLEKFITWLKEHKLPSYLEILLILLVQNKIPYFELNYKSTKLIHLLRSMIHILFFNFQHSGILNDILLSPEKLENTYIPVNHFYKIDNA